MKQAELFETYLMNYFRIAGDDSWIGTLHQPVSRTKFTCQFAQFPWSAVGFCNI